MRVSVFVVRAACCLLLGACQARQHTAQIPGGTGGAQVAAPAPTTMAGTGPGATSAGTGGAGARSASGGAGGIAQAGGSGPAPNNNAIDAGASKPDAAAASDAAVGAAGGAPSACDRACLIMTADAYLDALAAKNAASLMLSKSLKYTENGMPAQIGQGLWTTASKLEPDTKLQYADPMTGQVGTQIVVDENGATPVLYQMRLKVVDREITEIESMAVRQADAANGFFSVPGMKPEPVFTQAIDPGQRMSRDQLKGVIDHYIDYLDGKTGGAGVPFDMNCARYENGVATASGLASFQLQSWSFDVVPRYLVFDEEYGIVWGMFPFTHDPNTLVVGEAFKVISGKIMMIRAVMAYMPANAWD